MQQELYTVSANKLTGDAHDFWEEKKSFLNEHLKMQQDAEILAAAQENFVFISTAMIKLVNSFWEGTPLYVFFCL